jgi:hypothetical protein
MTMEAHDTRGYAPDEMSAGERTGAAELVRRLELLP